MAVLAHRVDGGGEPLLLLNGGLMSMAAWDPVVARLTPAYRIIRCDFRGQLMSLALGAPPAALDGHAADLVSLLDALEVRKAHVVGVSFGAFVAVALAAGHPDRVHTIVAAMAADQISREDHLEGTPLRNAVRAAAAGSGGGAVLDLLAPYTFSAAWLQRNRAVYEARRDQVASLPRAWFAGLDSLLGVLEGLDLRSVLPHITAPALVVAAEQDRMFPVDQSRALASGIAGARLAVVPGAAHGLVGEDPAAFADVIHPFLSSHSMKGPS